MDYFFYNTDVNAIVEQPRPRFRVLITKHFAATGGDRQRFGEQLGQLAKDDVLLMYENGIGVVAVGRVKEPWDGLSHKTPLYYAISEMKHLTGGAYEYRIAVDWFLDCSETPVGVETIKKRLGYTPRGAVRRIVSKQAEVARIIEGLWAARSSLPEEIGQPAKYVEGATCQVTVNAYERNPHARRRCVEHYGAKCCICGFVFGAVYGPEAAGYIHVHHIRPLAAAGGSYTVDPVKDLRPVCPNCHAVLHLGPSGRTIAEVQQLLTQHDRSYPVTSPGCDNSSTFVGRPAPGHRLS